MENLVTQSKRKYNNSHLRRTFAPSEGPSHLLLHTYSSSIAQW